MAATKRTGVLARLTANETFILIAVFRDHPSVWDCRLQDYRIRGLKTAAWRSIRQNFEELTNIKCSQDEVQAKVASLRSQFTRELRLQKNLRESGSGSWDAHVPNWPFFEALQFLTPVVTLGPSAASLDREDSNSTGVEEPSAGEPFYLPNPGLKEEEQSGHLCEEQHDHIEEIPMQRSPCPSVSAQDSVPQQIKAKKRKHDGSYHFEDSILSFLKSKHASAKDAPDQLWARNLAQKISEISDEKKRKLLKLDIDDLVNKSLREDINKN